MKNVQKKRRSTARPKTEKMKKRDPTLIQHTLTQHNISKNTANNKKT